MSVCCDPCTEGSRQLILCLVRCCRRIQLPTARRSLFSALVSIAILSLSVFVVLVFLGTVAPPLAMISLHTTVAAMTLLCVWCAVYVRDEPGLVSATLIGVAVLFLVLTLVAFRVYRAVQ